MPISLFARSLLACFLVWFAGENAAFTKDSKPQESDALFKPGQIHSLTIDIPQSEVDKIGEGHRPYVRSVLSEKTATGTKSYPSVGVKLKGAAGSFRDFHDRPALTLNMDKFRKNQSFHALDKFHLNNSVQDETYLHEQLCSELFLAAGCPTPRATHTRLTLNGRDLGLYVLKEGFDKTFLKRHFEKPNGNLYDGGFLIDLDGPMQKDHGDGPDDLSDVRAIAEACRIPNPQLRWKRIAELVDMDRFFTFMALERMTCHWDGYCNNRNNYRLYLDPATKKAVFFPHGMDQMFGDPGMPLFEHAEPLISAAVMQNNAWRKEYRERVKKLLPMFVPPEKITKRVDELAGFLSPWWETRSEEERNGFRDRVREFKERIVARAEQLQAQLAAPDPQPEMFDKRGILKLPTDWYPAAESEEVKHEEVELSGKRKAFQIVSGANGVCIASWRRRVLLGPGTYQFTAKCRTKGLAKLDDGDSGVGVGMHGMPRVLKMLDAPTLARPLEFEFTILEDQRSIELVAEVRTKSGTVWFDADSLTLSKKGK